MSAVSIAEPVSTAETSPAPPVRLKDLKEGAFSVVKEEFTNPTDAIEIINFIDFLAQNNAMSADDMPLPVIRGKGQKWELTRAEVTKLFFGHVEAKAEDIKKNIIVPNDDIQKIIAKAMQDRLKASEGQFKENIRAHLHNADRSHANTMAHLANARKVQEEIEALSGFDPSERMKAVIEGLQHTNWNFHKFVDGKIYFVNRSDVMLRHIEKLAGLHYELNCGKYRLSISLGDMSVYIFRHERNVPETICNPHPHIKSNGVVCFGNGTDALYRAQVKGDIVEILRIVDRLLPNYGDNPYTTIENFKKGILERDRLEKEAYGKKAAAGTAADDELQDQEILDDEPEFEDSFEWFGDSDGSDNDNDE